MREHWELEDLIASWTLDEDDWLLLANKTGATRLGFALLLKFFDLEGRFPADAGELPAAVVNYVARQVEVAPGELGGYGWAGRTIEYHRAQIRADRGFREATGADEQRMIRWLAGELCPVELAPDRLREDLLARLRGERIEPPGPSRVERIVGAARPLFDRRFTEGIVARLPPSAVEALEELITAAPGTAASTSSTTARTLSSPAKTAKTSRSRCSRCTYSNPRWYSSTPSSSSRSSPSPNGPAGSQNATARRSQP